MKKVLIARVDNLGDFILTTPFMSALKAACPDATLVFLGSASNLRLASRIRLIDEALPLTRGGVLANLGLIARLRRERFDLAVAFHPDTTLAAIVGLTGATFRVCYWFGGVRPLTVPCYSLCTHRIMTAAEAIREDHMVAHFMRPLSLAGIDTAGEPELVLPDEGGRFGTRADRLSGGRVEVGGDTIALQLCPKWLEDAWRPDEFRRLCQLASARFGSHRVVVLYQPEHERILRELLAVPADIGIAGCAGDLLEWMDTIKRCALYVGYDSGGVHVAAAWKKPVVDIFKNPATFVHRLWAPWKVPYVTVVKDDRVVENIVNGIDGLLNASTPFPR